VRFLHKTQIRLIFISWVIRYLLGRNKRVYSLIFTEFIFVKVR